MKEHTGAAQADIAATNEQAEAERKYAEQLAATAAARAKNDEEFQARYNMPQAEAAANIGANFNKDDGAEKTEEQLAKEQALLELENQRAAILHQISESRRYEDMALRAEIAGETEEAAMLEREATVRREAVTIMRQLGIQEEQSLSWRVPASPRKKRSRPWKRQSWLSSGNRSPPRKR